MFVQRLDIQVFEHREFLVYEFDEPLQGSNTHPKADAAHAITALECAIYPIFIIHGDNAIRVEVIDNEGKGRRMAEHFCYRRSGRTNEGNALVVREVEDEVSPSSADLSKLVPPILALPSSAR